MYDSQNIFAKILRKEIPAKIISECDCAIAIYDIFPRAKIHALVIPKGEFIDFLDFMTKSKDIEDFFKFITKVTEILGLNEGGFRLITNNGPNSCQEVPHFHVHILGGEKLSQ